MFSSVALNMLFVIAFWIHILCAFHSLDYWFTCFFLLCFVFWVLSSVFGRFFESYVHGCLQASVENIMKEKMPKKGGRWWFSWRSRNSECKSVSAQIHLWSCSASTHHPSVSEANWDFFYRNQRQRQEETEKRARLLWTGELWQTSVFFGMLPILYSLSHHFSLKNTFLFVFDSSQGEGWVILQWWGPQIVQSGVRIPTVGASGDLDRHLF